MTIRNDKAVPGSLNLSALDASALSLRDWMVTSAWRKRLLNGTVSSKTDVDNDDVIVDVVPVDVVDSLRSDTMSNSDCLRASECVVTEAIIFGLMQKTRLDFG